MSEQRALECPVCHETTVCGHEWHKLDDRAELAESALAAVTEERDSLICELGNRGAGVYAQMESALAAEQAKVRELQRDSERLTWLVGFLKAGRLAILPVNRAAIDAAMQPIPAPSKGSE